MGTILSSTGERGRSAVERIESTGWRRAARTAVRSGVGGAAGVVLLAALAAGPARAESTAVAGFGIVGPEPGEKRAAVLDLEYRFSPWRYGVGPLIGAHASSDGGFYARVGLSRDFHFGERWNANLNLAGGGYHRGNAKKLGRGFEFRSAVELSYEARPGMRLGTALAHLSNAGISESNPGIETVTLTISFTPSRMVKRR